MNNLNNFGKMNMPMGVNGNLGQQQQQQQQQQQMPALVAHYQNASSSSQGWQQAVHPRERARIALSLSTNLGILQGDVNPHESLNRAIKLETERFSSSSSAEEYKTVVSSVMRDIHQRRQLAASMMQMGNPMGINQAGNIPQTPMQNQRSQQGQQQFPSGFPTQLQHPMQPTTLPMTHQPSMGGISVNQMPTGQPQPQGQVQGPGQTQSQGQGQGMPMQGQNMGPPLMAQQAGMKGLALTPVEMKTIHDVANSRFPSEQPVQMEKLRAEVQSMPLTLVNAIKQKGLDPLFWKFREKVMQQFVGKKAQQAQQANQNRQQNQQNFGGFIPGQGPNPQPNGPAVTQPGAISGNQEFDYLGQQQANAARLAEAGHQVVPASNNPSGLFPGMTPNQSQQHPNGGPGQRPQQMGNTPQQQNHIQNQTMQAQAHARAQMQNQQAQAQMQARLQAQQNQLNLRGQMGGLGNMNQPLQQPTSNMQNLNRPFVPQGQPGSNAAQRPQQPGAPAGAANQLPPNGVPMNAQQALLQMQQRMAAANIQGQAPQTIEALRSFKLNYANTLPEHVRQQILNIPDDKFQPLLDRNRQASMHAANNPNGFQGPMLTPGGPQPSQPQGLGQTGGLGMNGINGPIQGGAMPGQAHLPPGMNPQQAMMHMQQQQQQAYRQQVTKAFASNRAVVQEMDLKPFPPHVITPSHRQLIGENVKTWAQLKEWAQQNQYPEFALPRLLAFQAMHYQHLTGAKMQNNQNPMLNPQQNMGMMAQPGQAPPAQMVPPGMMPQQLQQRFQGQLPMALANMQQPTPQEIQSARSKLSPEQQRYSDDQIRALIMNNRRNTMMQKQQQIMRAMQLQQQQQQQQQQPNGVPQQSPQPQRPTVTQPPMTNPVSQPTPNPTSVATPQIGANKANRTPQLPEKQQPQKAVQNGPAVPAKGVKRPNEDSEANADQQGKAINQNMVAAMRNLTAEQVQNLTPAQRDQYMRMRNLIRVNQTASGASAGNTPANAAAAAAAQAAQAAQKEKVKSIALEAEQVAASGNFTTLTSDVREKMQLKLRANQVTLGKLDQALRGYTTQRFTPVEEKPFRMVMESRARLKRNTGAGYALNEQVSWTYEQMENDLNQIGAFINNMKLLTQQKLPVLQGQVQNNGQPTVPPAQQPQGQESGQAPAPLNAANLNKLREQELKQELKRQQQQHQKPPSAPTTEKPPPFHIGAASPQGVPAYGQTSFDPNKLNMAAARKRQKTAPGGSSTSTPGGNASPNISKVRSPEMKRPGQATTEKPADARPNFRCPVVECSFSIREFENQEELEKHHKNYHAQVKDPLKFAIECMSNAMGFNHDGSPKGPKEDDNAANRGTKVEAAGKGGPAAKSAQTPKIKQDVQTPAAAASTPMNRVATQQGIKNSPSSMLKTPQALLKTQTPGTVGTQMQANQATPPKGTDKAMEKTVEAVDPWADVAFSPENLQKVFNSNDLPGYLPDFKDEHLILGNDPDALTWGQPRSGSPATTPESSKESTSTRESDISEHDNLQIGLNFDMPMFNSDQDAGADYGLSWGILDGMEELGVGLSDGYEEKMVFKPAEGEVEFDWGSAKWDDHFSSNAGLGDEAIPGWEGTEFGTGR